MGLISKMLAKFADDTERRIDSALDFDFTCALDHMVGRMSKFYDDFNDAMKFIKDTVSDFKVIVPFNEANETFEYGVDGDEIIVTIITSTGYRKTKASVPKNCLVDKMRHVINNKKNELIIIIPKDVKNDDKVKDIQDKIFAKVETARAKVNETADKVIKSIKERAEEVANSTNAPSTKKSNGNDLKVSKVVRNEKGQFVATKLKKKSNHKKNSVKNIVINQ